MHSIYLLMLLTCSLPDLECTSLENLVDVWWQIKISNIEVGNCYMFKDSGYLVESDGSNTWIVDEWAAYYHDDCKYTIYSQDQEMDVLGIFEDCVWISHNEKEYEACECSFEN